MTNRYKTYYPLSKTVGPLRLTYDDGELRIDGLDRDRAQVVEIRFRDVLLTRILDEGIRLRLLQELGTERALILVDEQSELLPWLIEESLRTRDVGKAKHFLVFAGEEIVDVVSLSEPELLNSQR
ncbi:hypothetical protein ABZN20_13890 [Methylococcus sp. ANG]|uniref:hypothetical protein n=1 Tax=unclassified Methylococcus TaxID=2618889 RepID=UPI001C52DC86|nr:hypothetical protein [Methylococcus sp. Mc7]QXP85202.1 hypothetical protein KW115_05605 [Methylococcus sp. Mc7]